MALILTRIRNIVENWYELYAYIDDILLLKNNLFNLFFVFLQEYTQGPCPNGKLMVLDRETGFGKCSCDSNLVYYSH